MELKPAVEGLGGSSDITIFVSPSVAVLVMISDVELVVFNGEDVMDGWVGCGSMSSVGVAPSSIIFFSPKVK